MLLGCHLSIGKGFVGALQAAEELGINALQIFSHNASSWRMKEIADETAASFQARFSISSAEYIVIHTMYLLNLASPDEPLFERSVTALEEEVRRAGLLGIDHIVTHLGAHKGSGKEAGIARIVDALDRVLASESFSRYPGIRLLLEDTAGAGTTMGTTFSELGAIINDLSDASRVGVCLDTCHAFAAGYELRTPDGLEETLAAFDREIGLDRLGLIHLNDSKFPLGSRRDRHAHIGAGELGEEAFSLIVNHEALRDLPFILETPKEIDGKPDADRINLALVRSLRHE
jgi:deoxyribonuclease-4